MFLHHLKYSIKTLLKNKGLIFWTLIFPILLATFFQMAFSDIESNESFDPISIAVVRNDAYSDNDMYKDILNELGDSNSESQVFSIQYVGIDKAKSLLEDNDITGYLLFKDEDVDLYVSGSGMEETIFKFAIEQINQSVSLVEEKTKTIMSQTMDQGNVEEIVDHIIEEMNDYVPSINDTTTSNLSYTMIEYYTLIAMACLYGSLLSMNAINQNLANMSSQGKRVSVAPTHKLLVVCSSFIASYLITIIGVLILFVYLIFGLGVDFGSHTLYVATLAIIGALAGVSLGIVIGGCIKTNENTKTGILMTIIMTGSFLSGMMGITMKYIVDKYFPIINMLNPASMITDGFYALYYYNTLDRFFFDLMSLLIFSIVMIMIAVIGLRGQKYDSI